MIFEGVSWNDNIGEITEPQFVAQGLSEGQYADFSPSDQVKLLKEVYRRLREGKTVNKG